MPAENQPAPVTTTTTPLSPEQTSTTPTPNPQIAGNDPAARNADGSIIDQSKPVEAPAVDPNKLADPAKPDAKGAVPESYTFTAGDDQHLDEAAIGEVTPIFKELGLDQAGVDKLTGFYNKQVGNLMQRGMDAVNTMREGWRNEVTNDPEIGSKLDAVKAEIGQAFTQLPPTLVAEVKEAMNLTGAGDHPAFVKTLYKFAQLINEGKPVAAGGPSPHGQVKNGAAGPPSIAHAMYPNLVSR